MQKKNDIPIFTTPAYLWDSVKQLTGSLELWETVVIFRLTDFKGSHLDLRIPLASIKKVEEFLVFDLAKNGLRIQDKTGKYDLFVLDEVRKFKTHLINALDQMDSDY